MIGKAVESQAHVIVRIGLQSLHQRHSVDLQIRLACWCDALSSVLHVCGGHLKEANLWTHCNTLNMLRHIRIHVRIHIHILIHVSLQIHANIHLLEDTHTKDTWLIGTQSDHAGMCMEL